MLSNSHLIISAFNEGHLLRVRGGGDGLRNLLGDGDV